jgi:hypothetical protein
MPIYIKNVKLSFITICHAQQIIHAQILHEILTYYDYQIKYHEVQEIINAYKILVERTGLNHLRDLVRARACTISGCLRKSSLEDLVTR